MFGYLCGGSSGDKPSHHYNVFATHGPSIWAEGYRRHYHRDEGAYLGGIDVTVPELILIDPLTFKIERTLGADAWERHTCKFLQEIAQDVKRRLEGKEVVEKLRIVGDELIRRLPGGEWRRIPAYNGFPGFFSSLADHAVATSTVGVALAQECLLEGKDLASEYAGKELGKLPGDRKGLTQVIRLGCLLHDAGKPLPGHAAETKRAVEGFLSDVGFGYLASELAEAASRHHYEKDAERPPNTLLEWIIAYADKVVAQDRSVLSKNPRALAVALHKLHAEVQDDRILEVAKVFGSEVLPRPEEQSEVVQVLLPLDEGKRRSLESELLNAPKRLGISEKPLSVLLLEAEGIQGIVRRAESLKGLIGFSALVELGMQKAADILRDELAPESVIFVGGGSLMALVPTSLYEELKEKTRRAYWETVQGAGGLKAPPSSGSVAFSLYELKNGPDFTWREAMEGPSRLSLRSFAQIYSLTLQALEPMQLSKGEQRLRPADACTLCRAEKALCEEWGERLGQVCLASYQLRNSVIKQLGLISIHVDESSAEAKFISSRDEASFPELPSVLITQNAVKFLCQRLNQRLKEKPALLKALAGKRLTFKPVETIDDLGRQMYGAWRAGLGGGVVSIRDLDMDEIAVIAGDGDNFGVTKSSMVSITQYRHVSDLFKEVIMDGLAQALSIVLLRQIESSRGGNEELEFPFLVVYAGGDDFLLLLDASASLIFLKGLNDYLASKLGSRTNEYTVGNSTQFIGLSLGVAVMKNRMPIYATLEAVEELKTQAKKKSKDAQAGGNEAGRMGTLCFGSGLTVALHRFTGLPSEAEVGDLFRERRLGDTGIEIVPTAWPRTSEELFGPAGFTSILEKLLEEGVTSGELKRVLRGGEDRLPEELRLVLRYKAARDGEGRREGRGPYAELSEKAVLFPVSFDTEKGVLRYAFPDIIEAMRIIQDRKELLPGLKE